MLEVRNDHPPVRPSRGVRLQKRPFAVQRAAFPVPGASSRGHSLRHLLHAPLPPAALPPTAPSAHSPGISVGTTHALLRSPPIAPALGLPAAERGALGASGRGMGIAPPPHSRRTTASHLLLLYSAPARAGPHVRVGRSQKSTLFHRGAPTHFHAKVEKTLPGNGEEERITSSVPQNNKLFFPPRRYGVPHSDR
ncbi:hypothetical protein J437_LFUL000351 [Ladona fulva]|uniref:Uncharacterized protein n=1 Tax=Ladona fulva TaxID=123851 RepID=A0A8K0JWK9_LADFU|nr:hypothetical protein J437_LFUL000351 [Ladona fulva]